MNPSQPQIRVKDLRVSYANREVIHGISFEVPKNEIFAIIGPAQSGKSSLLRCFNRTLEFVANAKATGLVEVEAENVARVRNVYELRRKIGMVAPLPVGLPLSIYDNVAFAPRASGIRDRRELDALVQQCLVQAALWDEVKDVLHRPGTALSGGQQQRLCIARTIVVEPELLLMDEPCSAIDPIGTAKVEELINELKTEYSIVIVTHNMQQAARVSDNTAFLYLGRLIEFGPTERLFTTPSKKETEDYITGRFG